MFPREYRLPINKKQDFDNTFPTPHFLLKTLRNRVGQNRLGVIISNVAVKKSARRHFWKRRFASNIGLWPNLNADILVIVSPKIESLSPKDLKGELSKILKTISTAI